MKNCKRKVSLILAIVIVFISAMIPAQALAGTTSLVENKSVFAIEENKAIFREFTEDVNSFFYSEFTATRTCVYDLYLLNPQSNKAPFIVVDVYKRATEEFYITNVPANMGYYGSYFLRQGEMMEIYIKNFIRTSGGGETRCTGGFGYMVVPNYARTLSMGVEL